MLRFLILHSRARHLLPVLLLYGLTAAAMFVWPGLVPRVADRCGAAPLDVRGYWTAADARELAQSCGPPGQDAYVHLQVLDLIYPAATGIALLLVTALLLRRHGGRGWVLLAPAVLMTAFDYAENAVVWTLLVGWPEIDPTVAAVGGAVTAVKRVAGFAAFTIPILLGIADLVHRGRSRLGSPGRSRSTV